jgi:acetyltransferase
MEHSTDLTPFFEPRNLAIIGSFKEGLFGGHVAIQSLKRCGFKGGIFPVNPSSREVLGLKVHAAVKDLPEPVDLAMVMINGRSVPSIIPECAAGGARGIILVSDGFAERDQEGARLQDEVVKIAGSRGIRILGPNTAGVVNTANGFNPCPYSGGGYPVKRGTVAVCAQTGMINPQAVPYRRLGISKVCDFGNRCDVDESDVLSYLENDPDTEVISMYLESIRDGRGFLDASRRVGGRKPILVLKSGRTREGAAASASHTGSMAMDDEIFDAFCAQAGVLRLEEFGEVFEMPKIFAAGRRASGGRLGIVTFTGCVAVLAIDEGARRGLHLAGISARTRSFLDGIFPGLGKMPVDIGPAMAAVKDTFDRYPEILKTVLQDHEVDCLFNVVWANPDERILRCYFEAYEGLASISGKPVATWVYGPDPEVIAETAERIEERGFPTFSTPERAVKALGLAARYGTGKDHPGRSRAPSS